MLNQPEVSFNPRSSEKNSNTGPYISWPRTLLNSVISGFHISTLKNILKGMAICLNFVYLHQLMDKKVIEGRAYRQARSVLKTTLSQVQQYTVSFLRSSFRSRLNYSLLMTNLILYLYPSALIKRNGRQLYQMHNRKHEGCMGKGQISQKFSYTFLSGKSSPKQYLNLIDSKRWCFLGEETLKEPENQDIKTMNGVDFIYRGKERLNPFSKIFGFRELTIQINLFKFGKSEIMENYSSFSSCKFIYNEKRTQIEILIIKISQLFYNIIYFYLINYSLDPACKSQLFSFLLFPIFIFCTPYNLPGISVPIYGLHKDNLIISTFFGLSITGSGLDHQNFYYTRAPPKSQITFSACPF